VLVDLLAPIRAASAETLARALESLDLAVVGLAAPDEHLEALPSLVRKNLVVVPRCIHESTDRAPLPPRRLSRRRLPLCVPRSLSVARMLAKVRSYVPIALRPDTLKFVDETQVNFMSSSRERKFIEVALGDFLELGRVGQKPRMSFERALHYLCKTIDRALRLDVGIVVSSGTSVVMHPLQIRAVLYSLGYTKRERALLTQAYPLELLAKWVKDHGRR